MNVVVTCYESYIELLNRYPNSGKIVTEIEDRGGMALYICFFIFNLTKNIFQIFYL